MKTILSPLINPGKEGIYCTGSDGAIRHVFPFLSCYIADYPEQCLVTCSKYTTCVKCKAKHDAIGDKSGHRTSSMMLRKWQRAKHQNSINSACPSISLVVYTSPSGRTFHFATSMKP